MVAIVTIWVLCVWSSTNSKASAVQIVHENREFAHTVRVWVRDWLKKIRGKCAIHLKKIVFFLLVDQCNIVARNCMYSFSHHQQTVTIKYINIKSQNSCVNQYEKSNMNKWREKLMNLTSVRQNISLYCCRFDPEYFHVFPCCRCCFHFHFGFGYFCCLQTKNRVFLSYLSRVLSAPMTNPMRPASHSANLFQF